MYRPGRIKLLPGINLTPGRVALGLGVVGTVYRAALVCAGLPATNSDEATMGLMARHVLAGIGAPTFFYGQHYMGALEAYLAVPVFVIAEPTTVALRVPTIAMYAGFVFAMYHVVRLVVDPWFAVATTGLFALGADRVVKDQLIAAGGYPEINLLAAALVVLAVVLARRPGQDHADGAGRDCAGGAGGRDGQQDARRGSRGRTRGVGWFAVFGLGAGLALWSDYLVAPYVLAAGAVLAAFRGRDLLGLPGATLVGGGLLGYAPVIAHDLTASPSDRSFAVLLSLMNSGADQAAGATLADHLYGGVLLGVPLATGLCRPSYCDAPVRLWGVALTVLLVVAALAAVAALARPYATGWLARVSHLVPARDRVAHATSLALAMAGLATIALYAKSPAAVLTPIESARYLSCLLVSMPVALWPLWSVVQAGRQQSRRDRAGVRAGQAGRARRAAAVAAVALLGTVAGASLYATGAVVADAGRVHSAAAAQQELLDDLARHNTTRIYSDYWTCNRLVFAAQERLICAVIGDDLRAGLDRYRPYREMLAHAPDPVYVLPMDSIVEARFAAHLAANGLAAEVRQVGGYRLYRPERPVGVP